MWNGAEFQGQTQRTVRCSRDETWHTTKVTNAAQWARIGRGELPEVMIKGWPMENTRTATCCCGQLSVEVQGAPDPGICHCLACQKRTGSVFAALAVFKPPYTVSGEAKEFFRRGDQGVEFTFRFCPICGTNLFHTENGFEDEMVLVAVGAFGDPGFPPPVDSTHERRKHNWVVVPDSAASHQADPE